MSRASAVEVNGVAKSFGDKRVLDSVDLRAEPGHITAIFGPSGSGKTTLLRLINGLEVPDAGEITVLGRRLAHSESEDLDIRRDMVLVTQRPVALRASVFDNVAYPLRVRGLEDPEASVLDALKRVGLEDFADVRAGTLSGGEMQRMCFARATVHLPRLLLLDEFTSHLDPANIRMLEGALREYVAGGGTAIIVTHNLFQARRLADAAAFLLDGRIVESGPAASMFEEPEDERTRRFIRGDMIF